MSGEPGSLERWLADHGWEAASWELLTGGAISSTSRLTRGDGSTIVVKQCPDGPDDLFVAEATGLAAIASAGRLSVPEVLGVGRDFLVLTDLGSARPDDNAWARLGRELAGQHLLTNDRFGFDSDNYLGRLPQHNPWTVDGHEFFVEQRILRYLDEPPALAALTPLDRSRLTALAARLPELVPVQPASLLHGDLWWANVLGPATPSGAPAVVDPACHYGWAEAELSMLWCCGRTPDVLWRTYEEVRPLDPGWQDRLPLLHLREHLSMIAHFGDTYGTVARVREVLNRY